MESQNSGAEAQVSNNSQPIGDGLNKVDVVDGGVMVELGSSGKRKRGRPPNPYVKLPSPPPPKAQAKPPVVKKIKEEEEEEDVCFICFDGGSLVLCDRRGCPKAYHPACIKRDAEFFESAAKWNCGWHICSICQKTAHHMCYTCTYSLCRGCIRKADYVCVRGDKGFCTICMKTIMLIENNGQGEDGKVQADFDDKLSWEYLFKVYWVYLKGKLALTLNELTEAKNPWKEASTISLTLPSAGVHNIADNLKSITSAPSVGNLEENESKRRKIDDEQINMQKETVNMEKPGSDESVTTVRCEEWATKELLDFVAHMKNGNTSVLSRIDVQVLMKEYINRNNLRDPKKKNQIICDSRLNSLFGKPRVGYIQMLKLLEHHFSVKKDLRKRRVNCTAVQADPDWNSDNMLTVGKDKKRRNRSKGEERALQNKLDEFAAVNVHNIKLIYLRRDLMENLLEDGDNFHDKVVGSIVRIRISGCDLKHVMYRLVQVVGTSKVDVPYKIDSKSTDVMLEVLNLDKEETVSIVTVSDKEFSEEECRRLQQSIRCGLVKHFTVGEIQEKAVALQSVRLNDWMEREILRLNHLCDVASEKGHKKGYRECVEKLQLLKTPEERERRLHEIPVVHSDPKMNPHYESDDTEEYFNKEYEDHTESKYSTVSSKNSRAPKKRASRLGDADSRTKKDEKPMNQTIATQPNIEDRSTKATTRTVVEKDVSGEKSQHEIEIEIDCNNGSTVTMLDQQVTLSSSVSDNAPETIAKNTTLPPKDLGVVWHYLDPNGKVQGPFSLVQLQSWSTTGYFPTDMRIWANHEDKSLLLTDVLKEQFLHYDNEDITLANKDGNKTEGGLSVCSAIPSSTVAIKLSDGHGSSSQSFGQNWSGNSNLNFNNPPSDSTVQLNNTSNMPTERDEANHVPTPIEAAIFDLPGPTPKKKSVHEDENKQSVLDLEVVVQDSGNPPSWSSASSLVVGGPKLPVSNDWGSGFKPLEVGGDHVATPTSNIDIDINIHFSQPAACNDFTTWHGMGEMIEFSTLAEESVSDLLAEVDAMESQYGLPSPTSRRNSFVDDLFNGSFDEFSPTHDQGTRSDGFSSSGDIQLNSQPTNTTTTTTTTTDEQINTFDFIKTSNGLQQPSFISSEINGHGQAIGKTSSGSMGFKWPELEKPPHGMIDINSSAKSEGDEGEIEIKTSEAQVKMKVENCHKHHIVQPTMGEMKSSEAMQALKTINIGAKLVTRVAQIKGLEGTSTNLRRTLGSGVPAKEEEAGEFTPPQPQPLSPPPPPPLPPLTLGLDPFEPPRDLGSESIQSKFNHTGNSRSGGNIGWDQNQRRHNDNNNPQDSSRSTRSSWNKQSSFDSGSGSGNGSGGGYSRPPSKGQQRVCRFYESGRCKKGASCKFLHPSP